ncbi:MAG: hypothetical protein OEO19_06815 [Gammaproteobacteria bacterium]|nr:hypothetical protein [Gammaproteobacteria bacterium]MDH3450052.1 hypothetical protein [Gammaproteobacteria bacterium]
MGDQTTGERLFFSLQSQLIQSSERFTVGNSDDGDNFNMKDGDQFGNLAARHQYYYQLNIALLDLVPIGPYTSISASSYGNVTLEISPIPIPAAV